MHRLMILCCLFTPGLLVAQTPTDAKFARIDDAVTATIEAGGCPGAVVLVIQENLVVYRKSFGNRTVEPSSAPMTLDAIFDLASLTKPIATATSIHHLIDAGKLKSTDKVSTYWPEFAVSDKGDVTIEQCLLHTTGLTADNAIGDYAGGKTKAFEAIAGLKLEAKPGTRFRYSDVGFLVLGNLVERITKMPLDEYAAKHVFNPIGMKDTHFKVPAEKLGRVAPTGKRDGTIIRGDVHDPRAYAIGGVAGHAGLFGTADDLAIYATMLLNAGVHDGKPMLSPNAVKLFTAGVNVPPAGKRSLGWDVATGFSAPRGNAFRDGDGFGHTGFTGTSLWIDPGTKTAIIILTNRVHPNDKGNVTELRRKIGTIVGEAVGAGDILPGIDVLRADKFAALKGKRIGLVTNHTGKAIDGTPTIDLLAAAPDVKLVALFSPEHGIRGELDENVGDGKDEKTGLPVYSLYGVRRKPTPEQLAGIDLLVYDIQDIGCRFYTYISTLGLILEVAKENDLPVLVLDRPNPLGGVVVDGPMRDAVKESFIAYHDLPLRHGMTVGELARMFNKERNRNVKLDVIAVKNWRRGDTFEATNLPWRNPSPNMRHLTAAFVYPGVGILETTNISVGRGTERPFEWIGAPYLDGRALAAELTRRKLPGVAFIPVDRTPTASVFKDKRCGGIDIVVQDWSKLESVALGLHLADALRKVTPKWEAKNLNRLLVHQATFDGLAVGKPVAELSAGYRDGLAKFRTRRAEFLLYRD